MRLRRLELDYLAPRRRPWLGVAILAAAVALAGHLVLRYRGVQLERTALVARLALLETGQRAVRPASAARAAQESRDVEAVLRQLALPWPQVIESIEATADPEVALLQLQPEPERRLLRLTAEAGTPEAMLGFVHRLGESRSLSDAHLVSHQLTRDRPARPIQFVAQATLRLRR